MRDRETIDSELRLIALRRQAIREQGGLPSSEQVDALLDERLGHIVQPPETEPIAAVAAPRRRMNVLLRYGPLAALPLSLLAVAIAVVVMVGAHKTLPPEPAAAPPPSSARPVPAAPQAHAPPVDIVDRALIDTLNHEGVPVPSREYVTTHGHAVCDLLARQPNYEEAVRFVQRSTIWDADQSASFTAGAVVSYCPQHMPTGPAETQPGLQNTLSDLQAVQGDLQRIQRDLENIQNGLPQLPGHQ
ncbi:hypothetical protein A5672_10715 [Mycobacterium alsense]|uniref:DUF732 domain-containing protein n=1 Tax=Mycobacterium alsense TaxID=324058 RepID=A0ABD6P6E4_9MYCO|nr:DUF732 domain-containing protein [Mycobacterium alsense]OBG43070.1 hypothetical protein A5672_10715 [Mycobacterium alsense]